MGSVNHNDDYYSDEPVNLADSLIGDTMQGVLAGVDTGNNAAKLGEDETLPSGTNKALDAKPRREDDDSELNYVDPGEHAGG